MHLGGDADLMQFPFNSGRLVASRAEYTDAGRAIRVFKPGSDARRVFSVVLSNRVQFCVLRRVKVSFCENKEITIVMCLNFHLLAKIGSKPASPCTNAVVSLFTQK